MAAIMPSNDVVCDGDLRTSGDKDKHPPIRCLYLHLHESIRAELSQLNAAVHQIEKNLSRSDVTNSLLQLRERYQLLMQVNRYHASVEDEVWRGPPAFKLNDAIVKDCIPYRNAHL